MPTPVPENPCELTPKASTEQRPAVEAPGKSGELDEAALDQIAAGKGAKGDPLGDPLGPPL